MGLNGNKHPWYKERLRTKYSKDVNPILNHKNWTYIKSGLDDFRDGMPPDAAQECIVRPTRGPEPNLVSSSSRSSRVVNSAARSNQTRRLTPVELYYSKQVPAADRRRRRVAQLEQNLLSHPLALFPHLENGLSPELYEEIVDILDPDLIDIDQSEDGEESADIEPNRQKETAEPKADRTVVNHKQEDKEHIPYEKLFRKKRSPTDNIKTLELERHEKKIKEIAAGFVEWSATLGEEGPALGEDTIQALFASGYSQSKQATSSVHVVELGSIPPELRAQAGLPPVPSDPQNLDQGNEKKNTRTRYGAWYLKPETWRLLGKGEHILDPEEVTRQENNEAKKAAHDLHLELAPLHGALAFRKYLEQTNKKKPEFMREIGRIQDEELAKDH